jgi:beta-glucosidase
MRAGVFLFVLVFSLSLKPSPEGYEARIADLINKMTLEEKVGQMTQLDLSMVAQKRERGSWETHTDPEKLRNVLLKYHVGSILNTNGMANSIESWNQIITDIQDVATKETRLKIPVIYGVDAIHGATYTKDATLFPQSIAMAATFNPELVYKSASVTALETRASGIPWNFNPVLDIGRNPLWSRLWETFGEDPYLASVMAHNYVKGIEGDNNEAVGEKMASCLKHYLGYGYPLNGRDRTPAWIPERILRDVFLPPFKAGIDAGALTVMANSSEINGIPVHSDYFLLTELLKGELGFKGFVVSDWEDIIRLHERDHVAETPEDAVRIAVMAGVDMSMVPYGFSFTEILLQLVKEGKVPVKRIDEAVARILYVKFRTGLFENPYPDKKLLKKFATEESGKLNLSAAQEAITLLKNDKNFLPLAKNKKVLVTGPTANLLSVLNGGWTITWQGRGENLYPAKKNTVLEAIEQKIGKENVAFSQGVEFEEEADIQQTVEKAQGADAVILCLGENTYCEMEGTITNLTLPSVQLKLARELLKTGKPVILVLIEGRPRVIKEIADSLDTIIMAYLPGMEGGQAVADIIYGDANPSGKLPFTYPRSTNGFVTYDRKFMENLDDKTYEEQFAFGHGLSYTTFEYSDLKLSSDEIKIDGSIDISVKVKNSGKLEGKEAVLLYGTDLYGSVSRPVKQLKRFKKINLKPGEEKEIQFTLTPEDFAFTGRNNKKVIETGTFNISVSKLSSEFKLVD